jgi:hypothetical protein
MTQDNGMDTSAALAHTRLTDGIRRVIADIDRLEPVCGEAQRMYMLKAKANLGSVVTIEEAENER